MDKVLFEVLATYSNVHRGEGHYSAVSTAIYERSREVILESLGLKGGYTVIFCSPRRANILARPLKKGDYTVVSSDELGLPLGTRALVVKTRVLPKGKPFETGGGTIKLVSKRAVVWADLPDRFEAGTPPIVNAVLLAAALHLSRCRKTDLSGLIEPGLTTKEILYGDDGLGSLSGRSLLEVLRERLMGGEIVVPTIGGEAKYVNADNGEKRKISDFGHSAGASLQRAYLAWPRLSPQNTRRRRRVY